MSWLSSALEKVGISKNTQRAVTNVVATVAAPVTGGLSTLLKTSGQVVQTQAQSVLQNAVQDVTNRVNAATTVVRTADAAATAQGTLANANPFLLIAASVGVALLLTKGGE